MNRSKNVAMDRRLLFPFLVFVPLLALGINVLAPAASPGDKEGDSPAVKGLTDQALGHVVREREVLAEQSLGYHRQDPAALDPDVRNRHARLLLGTFL